MTETTTLDLGWLVALLNGAAEDAGKAGDQHARANLHRLAALTAEMTPDAVALLRGMHEARAFDTPEMRRLGLFLALIEPDTDPRRRGGLLSALAATGHAAP